MEMLGIEPDTARYFHNALHDAYYTALVFARLPQPEDVLKYPQKPRPLIHTDKRERAGGETFGHGERGVRERFRPRAALPRVREEDEVRGRRIRPGRRRTSISALQSARQHGNMLIRVRLRLESDGRSG